MDFLALLAAVPGVGPYLPYVPLVVAAASVIATVLPAPAAGATGAYPIIYGLTNLLAANVGRARNAAGTVDAVRSLSATLLNATTAPAASLAPSPPPAAGGVVALLLLVLFGLSACGHPQPAATIAALESALTAADIAALQYTHRPACPVEAPICADAAVKDEIKQAAASAYAAVKQARASAASGSPVDLTTATVALAAYQAIIKPLSS